MADDKLDILIDVRSRLDDLVKAQNELRKLGKEANSAGQALKEGFGIDLAHRGIELLKESFKESVMHSFELAKSVEEQSKNLRIATEDYQILGHVIRDVGGEATQLSQVITHNNNSLVEARGYTSAAAAAYRSLGINIAELEGMSVAQRFERIGRALAESKDQTKAFSDASQILGSRNLPTVLAAVKKLSEEGLDPLAKKYREAGLIMDEETIKRLHAAEEALARLKMQATILSGEEIGSLFTRWDSFKAGWSQDQQGFFRAAGMDAARAFFAPWKIFSDDKGVVGEWLDRFKKPASGTVEDPALKKAAADAAQRLLELTKAQTRAEFELAVAAMHRETVEANPTLTDFQKKEHVIDLMKQELGLRQKLIDAAKAMPLQGNETPEARDLKIRKLEEQNQQLKNQLLQREYSTSQGDKEQSVRDNYKQFQQDGGIGSPNLGGVARLGAMEWVTNLGTAGEQVAQTLQSTLGAAVEGITDGIYGWITGTQTFGQAMAQLGGTILKMILHTIIQMGVQMLVNAVIGRTIQAASIAANIATASGTAAALSLIWAVPATLATIASFGGAAVAAPAEIAMANAITLGAGGFKVGGYTGDGPEDEIAGYVHGREGVLNAPAMKFLGRGFLNAMNKGDYASAANAAPAFAGSGGGAGGRESGRNTHIYLDRSAWLDAVANDLTGIAHEVYDQRARA